MCSLTHKYNVPGPRYTSYPTVPYWDTSNFSGQQWKERVKCSFQKSVQEGISVYIHLPFCEQMCTFCGCHKRITKRHEVERPYIKAVLQEWALHRELLGERPLIKELHLGGGTPSFFSPENLAYLIEGIFRMADTDPHAQLSFEGHPNNTTSAHLQKLYDLGFRRVCFGVQDYNSKVQKAINRVQSVAQVKKVTDLARSIGYQSVGHDLVYGLPFQTLENVEETLYETALLQPDRIALYSYAHVPWREGNGQRGFKDIDLPSTHEKQAQQEKGQAFLIANGYHEIGMDHYAKTEDQLYQAALNKELHRNFMGYTPTKTRLMIGLGASSISDSWNAFAQNVKSIEEYQHLVANDIIPVYRGHLLNEEDLIIRKHILNLMCRFETSWVAKEACLINFEQLKDRLGPLAADGLIIMSADSLKVTAKGKPFVRNICMAFDIKLQRKKPETRLFSMTV